MHRATPLGHDKNLPAPETNQQSATPAPAAGPAPHETIEQIPRPFSVLRGGAPAERPHRSSGEHRRRLTPARAVVQPSDPERLRQALEAMREMNKLTRRRTGEMRKLSALSKQLSEQMEAFGSVIGGLKISEK